MTYIKINETLYPATISGRVADTEWDKRESKSITLEMDYETAAALFVDGLAWSIVQPQEVPVFDENGNQTGTEMQDTEFDNSDYFVAGAITDNRNGKVTVKMGKKTDSEMLDELLEVLNND